ncbi:ABC transporter permease [Vibrio sp. 10N.261.55.A7]|uniref:ABC transporter permease n=1 Tax=Vibrio sp. 10N.261.55.A7 TaxID=1880851 RepID=UPI000C866F6B|nr:ABC transporter permease [Vibrio sp. 10N.261.55.A7]PMK02620.1 polyamine ABC transporter permease [Vibrio sp. 10N.261.55.A7]
MSFHIYSSKTGKLSYILYVSFSITALVFLSVPLIAVLPLSFSSDSFLSYPITGYSLQWYEEVLTSPVWMNALKNSIFVGVVSTIFATILGTLAALGINTSNFKGKAAVTGLMVSPMAVPMIIAALGLYFFFAKIGLGSTYTALIVAHTLLGTPFVLITVNATLQGFDFNLIRAAANLGASPLVVLIKVVLPLILPGVVSGALFAFATSFDEVVVAVFVAGPEQRTLPMQMFEGLRENITPAIIAVAMLLTLFSLALLLTLEFLRRRCEKMISE